jgi:hypothetical protein
MRKLLPGHHPSIDDLFKNGTRVLPEWHIDLTDLLFVSTMEKVSVPYGHPNPHEMYMTLEVPPQSHPMITSLLLPYLPPDHPENLDDMLRNPADFDMPNFHPSLARFLLPESTSDGEVVQETKPTEISAVEVVQDTKPSSTNDVDSTYKPSAQPTEISAVEVVQDTKPSSTNDVDSTYKPSAQPTGSSVVEVVKDTNPSLAAGDWVNPTITTWELPWFHPPIEWVADTKVCILFLMKYRLTC